MDAGTQNIYRPCIFPFAARDVVVTIMATHIYSPWVGIEGTYYQQQLQCREPVIIPNRFL